VPDRRPARAAAARRRAAVAATAATAAPRRARALTEALEKRVLLSGAGPLVISEFLADNSRVFPDENGEYSDWIEIHNPTPSPINLGGYVLADSAARWTLPSVNLAAGAYRVVFASDKNRTGATLHTNFKLSAEGEYLGLIRPDGVTVSDEYAPQYPEQVENVSYGVFGGSGT